MPHLELLQLDADAAEVDGEEGTAHEHVGRRCRQEDDHSASIAQLRPRAAVEGHAVVEDEGADGSDEGRERFGPDVESAWHAHVGDADLEEERALE